MPPGPLFCVPPHNLREVVSAVVKIIDNRILENRETEIEEILKIIKGPDFPTGAIILGTKGIEEAYRTGRGKIRVRAVTEMFRVRCLFVNMTAAVY